jgi:polyhydroxyalkanoate synthase
MQVRFSEYRREIALASAVSFSGRVQVCGARPGREGHHGLWELWIECAEQAYAKVAHKQSFSSALTEWFNASVEAYPGWLSSDLTATGPIPRNEAGGCSLSRTVWRAGPASLQRILPLPFKLLSRSRPVLVCYSLINRPYILDLNPQCSWVRGLLASGRDVYVIEWQEPPQNKQFEIADYIERYLGGCIRFVLNAHRIKALDLIGVCQGGTFSLCYAALHPQRVANLVTITTPVDFHTSNDLLSKWARGVDTSLLERCGTIAPSVLCGMFLLLRPFKLTLGKYLQLIEHGQDRQAFEDFARVERWTRDGLPQAAKTLAQFVKWFYQENRLVRGTLEIAGHRVKLGRVVQPVLNIFATRDHVVPAPASAALRHLIGSKDYCEHAVEAGHVGLYASRRRSPATRARLVSWLDERR